MQWTFHSRAKMRHYRLTEQRVRRVLHSPARTEEGIAPRTLAAMQPVGNGRRELWVMYTEKPSARTIISAWLYPGRTKPRSDNALGILRSQYEEYARTLTAKKKNLASRMRRSKWLAPAGPPKKASAGRRRLFGRSV